MKEVNEDEYKPTYWEELRQKNYELNLQIAVDTVGESNKRVTDIINSLNALATFLITLTSPFSPLYNKNNIDLSELEELKILLLSGWGFLVLSIILGLVQSYLDRKMFKSSIGAAKEKVLVFEPVIDKREQLINMLDKNALINKLAPKPQHEYYLLGQTICFGIGLILIFVSLIKSF